MHSVDQAFSSTASAALKISKLFYKTLFNPAADAARDSVPAD
jgi:hypothetical protein